MSGETAPEATVTPSISMPMRCSVVPALTVAAAVMVVVPADGERIQHVLLQGIAVRVGRLQPKRPEGRIRRSRQVGGSPPEPAGQSRDGRWAPRLAIVERERQLHVDDGCLRRGDLMA